MASLVRLAEAQLDAGAVDEVDAVVDAEAHQDGADDGGDHVELAQRQLGEAHGEHRAQRHAGDDDQRWAPTCGRRRW